MFLQFLLIMLVRFESIFAEEPDRREGIGSILAREALKWMENRMVKKKQVTVSFGNEETWKFYQQLGLFQRMTVLQQVL